MSERHEHLKRALRTVKRSIETSESVTWTSQEANRVLAGAVQQLTFVVEKLIEELGAKDSRTPEA